MVYKMEPYPQFTAAWDRINESERESAESRKFPVGLAAEFAGPDAKMKKVPMFPFAHFRW